MSYLLCEVPANLALKWSRPSRWLPLLVVGFSLASMSTALATNFW